MPTTTATTTTTTDKASSTFRPRRSHVKSRRGCDRCKQQRKKCDEARPICSRCNKRNHWCRYHDTAKRDSAGESTPEAAGEEATTSPSPSLTLELPESGYLGIPDLSPSCSSSWLDNACATDSTTGSLSPYALACWFDEVDEARIPGALSSQELELLDHYITHTSRIIPLGEEDLYALHVGIPNLAFGSEALMASVLALAAACKSHDIVTHSLEPLGRLDEVRGLLSLADRHHRTSLHRIQVAMQDAQKYDHVLANAALMVLYGSSSHCVRVSLAQTARQRGVMLEDELLPTQSQSQWMTLIRAAHTAFTGLLSGQSEDANAARVFGSPYRAVDEACAALAPTPGLSVSGVYFPEDGPSERTKRSLLPIVRATYGPALDRLAAKVQSAQQTRAPRGSARDLEACFASHQILEHVFGAVFTDKDKEPLAADESEFVHPGRLRSVSPWLGSYLGRVTWSTPSKPLRRTIMAFLNRVPLEYLHMVQSTLDVIPTTGPLHGTNGGEAIPMTSAHRLAMDVFAHWLVLVMLLDGVWWIGGIGEWELGRIVCSAHAHGWGNEMTAEPEGTWWPESMYNAKEETACGSAYRAHGAHAQVVHRAYCNEP